MTHEFQAKGTAVWLAALGGDLDALARLADSLTTDELGVYTHSGEWVAYSQRLQHFGDDESIAFREKARADLIPVLNALVRRRFPQSIGVSLTTTIRLDEDGTPRRTVIHGFMAAWETGHDGSPGAGPYGKTLEDRIASLALTDGAVLRVLQFLDAPDGQLWGGLCRVREAIADDLAAGRSISAGYTEITDEREWVDNNWLLRLWNTANSPAAWPVGRHGRVKDGEPGPVESMTLDEAQHGIRGLLVRWIEWKLAGSPPVTRQRP